MAFSRLCGGQTPLPWENLSSYRLSVKTFGAKKCPDVRTVVDVRMGAPGTAVADKFGDGRTLAGMKVEE